MKTGRWVVHAKDIMIPLELNYDEMNLLRHLSCKFVAASACDVPEVKDIMDKISRAGEPLVEVKKNLDSAIEIYNTLSKSIEELESVVTVRTKYNL